MIEIKSEYLYVGGGARGNVGGLVHERLMRTIDLCDQEYFLRYC